MILKVNVRLFTNKMDDFEVIRRKEKNVENAIFYVSLRHGRRGIFWTAMSLYLDLK